MATMKDNKREDFNDPRLVEMLNKLRSLPPRDPQAAERAEKRFLAELEAYSLQTTTSSYWDDVIKRLIYWKNNKPKNEEFKMSTSRSRFAFTAIAVILVIFVFLFSGSAMTALAAQSALPGDALYPFKMTLEQTRLSLVRDSAERARLQLEFAERRLSEIEALIAEGRYHNIAAVTQEFEGYIKKALAEVDTISNSDPAQAAELLIQITDALSRYATSLSTMLNNVPEPARTEIIRAIQALKDVSDDEKLSTEIEFSGIILSMTENVWQIDDRQVKITDQTELKSVFDVGNWVKVHAFVGPDGELTAREIEPLGTSGDNTNENINSNENINTNVNVNTNTNINTNANTNTNTNINTNTNTNTNAHRNENTNTNINTNENVNDNNNSNVNSNLNDNSNDNRNSNDD